MTTGKLGVCVWVFGGAPIGDIAPRAARLGYEGLELPGDPDRFPVTSVRQVLADHGLSVLSLDPSGAPLDVDLAHPDAEVRQGALNHYFRVLDYAAELGGPVVVCHGLVGRVRPLSSQSEEERLFVEEMVKIAERASSLGLQLALEVLNRYESHLINNAAQAKALVETVDIASLGILLDTYHMNIEEPDPAAAVSSVGQWLRLFHAADSNRRAVGRGHVPFPAIVSALQSIAYGGPVVVECTAQGPDPFTPIKQEGWQEAVWEEVAASIQSLKRLTRNSEQ